MQTLDTPDTNPVPLATPITRYRELIFWAALIGTLGGLLALAYFYLMQGGIYLVWQVLKPLVTSLLPASVAPWLSVLLVTTLGGLCVGLALKLLGTPGEIAAVIDNIHMKEGRLNIRQSPAMTVISLVSIAFGGSAGPEAPLVQVIGSFGSWVADRMKLRLDLVRTLTFCGMSAALGAFFGAPLGGALFALEIPHRRGLEYYEALIPSLTSAICSYWVFRSVVGFEMPLYSFPHVPEISAGVLLQSVVVGILGGGAAMLFVFLFRRIEKFSERFHQNKVLLATLGGFSFGLIAILFPTNFPITTLFWGEMQIRDIIRSPDTLLAQYGLPLAVGLLLVLAVAKMIAIGTTLHSGFRGGFIFPLFFVGAALGLAVSLASHEIISPTVAILCAMAAINSGVTKTPISTSVILASLTNVSLLPALAIASLMGLFVTTRVSLIATQRPRSPIYFGLENANIK